MNFTQQVDDDSDGHAVKNVWFTHEVQLHEMNVSTEFK